MNYRNMMDFSSKAVLVTGGTGSLGGEFAAAFASCGADVAITGRDEGRGAAAAERCAALGAKAFFIKCDLRETAAIPAMIEEAAAKLGGLDVLCNHAGFNDRKPVCDYTEGDWERLMAIDLKAPFFVASAAAKLMIGRGKGGRIINTSSVSEALGHKNLSIYAAAKGGLRQLTKVMAHEWAGYGITVNAVAPGYVESSQTKGYLGDQNVRSALLSKIPMARFGALPEIASAVLFLASEGASYITGQTLFVEGGRMID
ncbi:MAG: SDR family oxidoreductase [Cloacibacillus sp.]